MQTQRTFIDDLKHQFKHGGSAIRLIFVNVLIFLAINIALVFGRLLGNEPGTYSVIGEIFTLNTSLKEFITHPWGLITSMFAHFSVLHLLFNMVFLYFSGRLFEQMFNGKRLFYTFILGGLAGGVFEILAHLLFPALQDSNQVIVGASGSIMAIFFAIAFHKPQLKVNLFGVIPVRIIILAGVFLLMDFLNLGQNDGTAHFAHLGGAVIGMISVQNLHSSNNLITSVIKLGDNILEFFSSKKRSKLKVKKGNADVRREKDEDYNARKKTNQEEIDRILDKISKSGYESLTKREKDFLFNQSKNG